MKSLLLYFNPKKALKKQRRFFKVFCFSPENRAEHRLGWLYFILDCQLSDEGDEKIESFAEKTKEVIKNEFYSSIEETSEEALKIALCRVNQFIYEKLKNKLLIELLNTAVLVLSPGLTLYLTSTGKTKVMLLRAGEIFDLSKNNQSWRVEKTFQNIIKGEINKKDRLIILNHSVFKMFYEQEIIRGLSGLPAKPKLVKKYLKTQKPLLSQLFGFLLFVFAKPKKIFFVPSLPKTKPFRLILYLMLLGLLLIFGSLMF